MGALTGASEIPLLLTLFYLFNEAELEFIFHVLAFKVPFGADPG